MGSIAPTGDEEWLPESFTICGRSVQSQTSRSMEKMEDFAGRRALVMRRVYAHASLAKCVLTPENHHTNDSAANNRAAAALTVVFSVSRGSIHFQKRSTTWTVTFFSFFLYIFRGEREKKTTMIFPSPNFFFSRDLNDNFCALSTTGTTCFTKNGERGGGNTGDTKQQKSSITKL